MNTLGARRDCRLILRLNVRYRRECVQPATSGTEQERRRASHRELQSTEAPPLTPSFAIIGWFFPGGLSIEAATRNDSPKRAEPTNSGCTRAEPTCRIARDKPRRRGLFRGTLERGKKISARIVQAGRCAGLFPPRSNVLTFDLGFELRVIFDPALSMTIRRWLFLSEAATRVLIRLCRGEGAPPLLGPEKKLFNRRLNITETRKTDPPLNTCWRRRSNFPSSQLDRFFMKEKIRKVPV